MTDTRSSPSFPICPSLHTRLACMVSATTCSIRLVLTFLPCPDSPSSYSLPFVSRQSTRHSRHHITADPLEYKDTNAVSSCTGRSSSQTYASEGVLSAAIAAGCWPFGVEAIVITILQVRVLVLVSTSIHLRCLVWCRVKSRTLPARVAVAEIRRDAIDRCRE